jgi:hypothetical protein
MLEGCSDIKVKILYSKSETPPSNISVSNASVRAFASDVQSPPNKAVSQCLSTVKRIGWHRGSSGCALHDRRLQNATSAAQSNKRDINRDQCLLVASLLEWIRSPVQALLESSCKTESDQV